MKLKAAHQAAFNFVEWTSPAISVSSSAKPTQQIIRRVTAKIA
jgi:hypothetical protein